MGIQTISYLGEFWLLSTKGVQGDLSSVTNPRLGLEGWPVGCNHLLYQPPLWSASGIPETATWSLTSLATWLDFTGSISNLSIYEPPWALFLCHFQCKSLHNSLPEALLCFQPSFLIRWRWQWWWWFTFYWSKIAVQKSAHIISVELDEHTHITSIQIRKQNITSTLESQLTPPSWYYAPQITAILTSNNID